MNGWNWEGDGKREFPVAEILKPRGFKEERNFLSDDAMVQKTDYTQRSQVASRLLNLGGLTMRA